MAQANCHNCIYSCWDLCQAVCSMSLGWAHRPMCANHPDTPSLMRPTPVGAVCRNCHSGHDNRADFLVDFRRRRGIEFQVTGVVVGSRQDSRSNPSLFQRWYLAAQLRARQRQRWAAPR